MNNRVIADMRSVVALMNESLTTPVQYMPGHIAEINYRLLSRNVNPTLKNSKYPLIALRLDTKAKVVGGMLQYTLNIAILSKTDKNYNAEERETNVFIPILNPIYDAFMKALGDSGLFTWGADELPPHTRVDRYFWSTPPDAKETKNVFTDPLDAIELIDLQISSEIKNC